MELMCRNSFIETVREYEKFGMTKNRRGRIDKKDEQDRAEYSALWYTG